MVRLPATNARHLVILLLLGLAGQGGGFNGSLPWTLLWAAARIETPRLECPGGRGQDSGARGRGFITPRGAAPLSASATL